MTILNSESLWCRHDAHKATALTPARSYSDYSACILIAYTNVIQYLSCWISIPRLSHMKPTIVWLFIPSQEESLIWVLGKVQEYRLEVRKLAPKAKHQSEASTMILWWFELFVSEPNRAAANGAETWRYQLLFWVYHRIPSRSKVICWTSLRDSLQPSGTHAGTNRYQLLRIPVEPNHSSWKLIPFWRFRSTTQSKWASWIAKFPRSAKKNPVKPQICPQKPVLSFKIFRNHRQVCALQKLCGTQSSTEHSETIGGLTAYWFQLHSWGRKWKLQ